MKVILASASTLRKDLLSYLGIPFKVIPSRINEKIIGKKCSHPSELVLKLATVKAEKVAERFKKQGNKDFLVIGADSIVALLQGKKWCFLGKPKNKFQARKTALLLKGKSHFFYTGLAVVNDRGEKKTAVGISKVFFKDFSSKTLKNFLESRVWQGRAGGYDIKLNKSDLIAKYEGSYTNILGLPLEKLKKLLKEFGIKLKL